MQWKVQEEAEGSGRKARSEDVEEADNKEDGEGEDEEDEPEPPRKQIRKGKKVDWGYREC